MKMTMACTILATTVLLAFPVSADYKEAIRDDIHRELGAFLKRNDGNKITVDVVDGLSLHLLRILEVNKIVPEAHDKSKMPEMPKMKTK